VPKLVLEVVLKANLDDDGDGIPNKDDPDFVRQSDGTGTGSGTSNGTFVDENNNGEADGKEDWDNDGILNAQDEDYTVNK